MKCDYCDKTITSMSRCRYFKVTIVKEGKSIHQRTVCVDCYVGNKRNKEPRCIGIYCRACGNVSITDEQPSEVGIVSCVVCKKDIARDFESDGVWNYVKLPE